MAITTAAGTSDGDTDGQVEGDRGRRGPGRQGHPDHPQRGRGEQRDRERPQRRSVRDRAGHPAGPADTVDITFATDNFKAGELIGKWTAAQLDGKQANIALLDLFNDKVVSVDYNRDQGFLTGMGIDAGDPKKNGDEAKSGSYTGGKGGSYTIACNEPTQGASDQGKTAMENCLSKTKDINVVYTINEPAAAGAAQALQEAGVKDALIVSVDGGCSPGLELVKDGTIGATSQQYPLKMAELGVEAIKKVSDGGEKPAVTPGLDFYDTGVSLVTEKKVEGLDSISVAEGEKLCWG